MDFTFRGVLLSSGNLLYTATVSAMSLIPEYQDWAGKNSSGPQSDNSSSLKDYNGWELVLQYQ